MKLIALPPIYKYQDHNGLIWTVERFNIENKVFWMAESTKGCFRENSKKEVLKKIKESYNK